MSQDSHYPGEGAGGRAAHLATNLSLFLSLSLSLKNKTKKRRKCFFSAGVVAVFSLFLFSLIYADNGWKQQKRQSIFILIQYCDCFNIYKAATCYDKKTQKKKKDKQISFPPPLPLPTQYISSNLQSNATRKKNTNPKTQTPSPPKKNISEPPYLSSPQPERGTRLGEVANPPPLPLLTHTATMSKQMGHIQPKSAGAPSVGGSRRPPSLAAGSVPAAAAADPSVRSSPSPTPSLPADASGHKRPPSDPKRRGASSPSLVVVASPSATEATTEHTQPPPPPTPAASNGVGSVGLGRHSSVASLSGRKSPPSLGGLALPRTKSIILSPSTSVHPTASKSLTPAPSQGAKSPPASPPLQAARSPTLRMRASAAASPVVAAPHGVRPKSAVDAAAAVPHPPPSDPLPVGAVVTRNPKHWRWGEQDGGAGRTGVVLQRNEERGYVVVKWYASGAKYRYRYGIDGAEDVARSSTFHGFLPVPSLPRLLAAYGWAEVETTLKGDLSATFGHPHHLTIVTLRCTADTVSSASRRRAAAAAAAEGGGSGNSSGSGDGVEYRLEGVDEERLKKTLREGVTLNTLAELQEALEKEEEAEASTKAAVEAAVHNEQQQHQQQEPPGTRSPPPRSHTPPSPAAVPSSAAAQRAYGGRFNVPPQPSAYPIAAPVAVSAPVLQQAAAAPPQQDVVATISSAVVGTAATHIEVLSKIDPSVPRLLKLTLRGDTTDLPVIALKKTLEAYTGVPAAAQSLEHDGRELRDDERGAALHLRDNMTFTLRLRLASRSPPPPVTYRVTENAVQSPVATQGYYTQQAPLAMPHPVRAAPWPQVASGGLSYVAHTSTYRSISPPRR